MTAVLARLRRRLTFANVTSGVALFVALGGTSYAAIQLPADSVGSDQIRSGAVGQSEISRNAVGRSEIRTGGVGSAELRTDSVRGWEIRANSIGSSEMKKDSVTTDAIKDGSVTTAKLDDATRTAIGVRPYRADVTGAGGVDGGNAKAVGHTAPGVYTVDFGADVSKCTAVASLANVDAANAGAATVAPGSASTAVTVHTYRPGATPTTPTRADLPFHVVVAC